MSSEIIGDQINQTIGHAIGNLFRLGELIQFSYNSFDHIAISVKNSKLDSLEIRYPLGMHPDGSLILGKKLYSKNDYIKNYEELAFYHLPLNGVYQLVTNVEALFSDLVQILLLKYPEKIGKKKKIPLSSLLGASSLEEIHLRIVGSYLNDLNYKSPKDFADSVSEIFSINLLEIPSFHSYVEIKATRDIFIHNRGMANEIYREKSGSHSRVHDDSVLPMNTQYFMQSLEYSISMCEVLEKKFHNIWESREYIERKSK